MKRQMGQHRPSPALVVSLLALFVALGGVGMAATGGNFILGQPNSADQTTVLDSNVATGPTLKVTNTGNKPAARFGTNSGVAPFWVQRATKVENLNADWLDGLDSAQFVRNKVPLSLTGSTATNGVLTGTNTGAANGVQGVTASPTASGVYGENDGTGFGVAGRANSPGGVGVYAESIGGGPALVVRTAAGGAPPMSVNSTAKVANLNADFVDGLDPGRFVVGEAGGRLLANRLAPAVPGRVLLGIPGMGLLSVDSCDGSVGGLVFDTAGTGKVDLMFSGIAANPSGGLPGIGPDIDSVITDRWQLPSTRVGPTTWGGYTLNIARDTGLGTKIATIWVNWYAVGCRFQAQAIESPQL